MTGNAVTRLQYLCNNIPSLLKNIPEQEFSHRAVPTAWSKKEIMGHLIDSATNNHQRFVRVQFEDIPCIFYAQDNWVAASRYNDMPSEHVIDFWEAYNRHLIEVIKRIPADHLARQCETTESQPLTLQWLIDDYVAHMEHHLHEVVVY